MPTNIGLPVFDSSDYHSIYIFAVNNDFPPYLFAEYLECFERYLKQGAEFNASFNDKRCLDYGRNGETPKYKRYCITDNLIISYLY